MNQIEIQQLCKRRRYLSVKEAAEVHGVCTKFIYDRIGQPNGPPYRRRGRKINLPTYEFLVWSEQPETA